MKKGIMCLFLLMFSSLILILSFNLSNAGFYTDNSNSNYTEWAMKSRDLNHSGWDGIPFANLGNTTNRVVIGIGGYISSPAIDHGFVYVGSSDYQIYQWNASSINELIGNFSTQGNVLSSPAVANGFVYVGSDDGQVYQLNASNITQLVSNYSTGDRVLSSPAVANGFVYVGSNDGQVYQLNASNVSNKIANFTTNWAVYSSPAVANGYVYIGGMDGSLYQLNASNISHFISIYSTGGPIYSAPSISNGYVYVGSNVVNKIYQLNATDINQDAIAIFDTPGYLMGDISVANGYVYFGSDKYVYQLNASNISHHFANYTADGEIYSTPSIANGYVYIGSMNGSLYQLNASNISKLFSSFSSDHGIRTSASVANGSVYFGSNVLVYQLNAKNISLDNPLSSGPYFSIIPNFTFIHYRQGFGAQVIVENVSVSSYRINWTNLFSINGTGFFENISSLAAGNYQIEIIVNDTSGNKNSEIYNLSVNKESSNINLYLNGTRSNISIKSGDELNISAFSVAGEGQINVYLNSVLINWGNSHLSNMTTFLTSGQYNITAIYFSTQNFSYSSETFFVNVLFVDTEIPYFTYIPADSNISYNQQLSVQFNASDNVGIDNYNINWTTFFSIDDFGHLRNITTLPVGNYQINVTINDAYGNVNSTIHHIRVNKSSSNTILPLLNGMNSNITLTYPLQFNASYSGTSVGEILISINGQGLNKSQNYTFKSGGYIVQYNLTGNENYSEIIYSLNLTINKAESNSKIYFNGINKNVTILPGNFVNLTAILIRGEEQIRAYLNGILINTGYSSLSNLTTFFNTGFYNFTVTYLETQNYSASSSSLFINVSNYNFSEGNNSPLSMFRSNLNHSDWDGESYFIIQDIYEAFFYTNGLVDSNSNPTLANGYVYVGSGYGDNNLYQLNASNISQLIANYTTGGAIDSSPSVANGYVYIGGMDGNVYQLNASNVSKLVAIFETEGSVSSSPAVANGYVYIGSDDGNVYQLNASNISKLVAIFETEGSVSSSPAVANGYVYIGSDDGNVYQLNADYISQLISGYVTGGSVSSSPAVANGYVYIGSDDGQVYQLNADYISQLISGYVTGGSVSSSPAVANGYVYIGSDDGQVYQLNASNVSQFISSYTTGDFVDSSPTIFAESIYVSSADYHIYQLNLSNISDKITSIYTGGIFSLLAASKGYLYYSDGFTIYQINNSDLNFFSHPIVAISYPLTYYPLNISHINYTIIGLKNNLDKCWCTNNGGIWNSSYVSPGENFTNITTIEGQNEIILYCNDTLGQVGVDSQTYLIDHTLPFIEYYDGTANDGSVVEANNIFVRVFVSEVDEKNITYNLYNSSMHLLNSLKSTNKKRAMDWTGLGNGAYYYNVTVCDSLNGCTTTPTRLIILSLPTPEVEEDSSSGGGGGGGGGSKARIYIVSLAQLSNGWSKMIAVGDKVSFKIDNNGILEDHTLTLNSVKNNSATLEVSSDPQIFTLNVKENKKVSLISNNYNDLLIKLDEVTVTGAKITLQGIHEVIEVQNNDDVNIDLTQKPIDLIVEGNKTNLDNETKYNRKAGLTGMAIENLKDNPVVWSNMVFLLIFLIIAYFIFRYRKNKENKN